MKLRNSTDFPDHFLRRMLSWTCKQLGLPAKKLRSVQFTFYRGRFRGRACGSRILVRIHRPDDNSHTYPFSYRYPGLVDTPEIVTADRIEAMLSVAFHEVVHVWQYHNGARYREAATERATLTVLEFFRKDREALLAAWMTDPKPRNAAPLLSITEKRAAKAVAMLEQWARKFKLAQSKVRKYKKRVAYYEQRQAAKRAPEKGK